MPEKFIDSPQRNGACPICTGADFLWGNLNYDVAFRPYTEAKGFLAQISVEAIIVKPHDRLCNTCGNVQTFAGRTEK